jgi:hypothetical protein
LLKNWFQKTFKALTPLTPFSENTSLTPKRLLNLSLYDPYGEGVALKPEEADLLGAFTDEALNPNDFDPSFPAAMRELLGDMET